jgi:hypothetical protein
VSGTARRKPARSSRSRHRFLLRHSPCKADTATGRVSLAGQRTDRPGNDMPGSEPSQPKPEPVTAVPLPVMSLPSHPASRAPRSQTRPAAQPVYLCIAAVCGNARSCRRPDDCEMPLLLLATPYGVDPDLAIGSSATGFRRTPAPCAMAWNVSATCCHAAGCGVTPVTVAGWLPHALTGHDGRDGNDSADAGRPYGDPVISTWRGTL